MWKSVGLFCLFGSIYLSLMLGYMVGFKEGLGWHPDYEVCQNFCGKLEQTDMNRGLFGFGETVCTCKADGKQLRY